MKSLSDEQLELIGKDISKALTSWAEVWKVSMKGFPINSPEYRAVCQAGKKITSAYLKMQSEAIKRGWPQNKMKEIFNVTSAYSFN